MNLTQVTTKPKQETTDTKHEEESQFSIFVGGCHPDTTEELMRGYFSKYGEILNVRMMMDKLTGKYSS